MVGGSERRDVASPTAPCPANSPNSLQDSPGVAVFNLQTHVTASALVFRLAIFFLSEILLPHSRVFYRKGPSVRPFDSRVPLQSIQSNPTASTPPKIFATRIRPRCILREQSKRVWLCGLWCCRWSGRLGRLRRRSRGLFPWILRLYGGCSI